MPRIYGKHISHTTSPCIGTCDRGVYISLIFDSMRLSYDVWTRGGRGGRKPQKWSLHFSKKWFFQRATSLSTLCLYPGYEVSLGHVSSAGARGSNTL